MFHTDRAWAEWMSAIIIMKAGRKEEEVDVTFWWELELNFSFSFSLGLDHLITREL